MKIILLKLQAFLFSMVLPYFVILRLVLPFLVCELGFLPTTSVTIHHFPLSPPLNFNSLIRGGQASMFPNSSPVIFTIFPHDNQALFKKEFSWWLIFLLEIVLIELFWLFLICAQLSERLESHNVLHGQIWSVSWWINFFIYVSLKYL